MEPPNKEAIDMALPATKTTPVYSGHQFSFSHKIASVAGTRNKALIAEVYGTSVEFVVTDEGKKKFFSDPAKAAEWYESI